MKIHQLPLTDNKFLVKNLQRLTTLNSLRLGMRFRFSIILFTIETLRSRTQKLTLSDFIKILLVSYCEHRWLSNQSRSRHRLTCLIFSIVRSMSYMYSGKTWFIVGPASRAIRSPVCRGHRRSSGVFSISSLDLHASSQQQGCCSSGFATQPSIAWGMILLNLNGFCLAILPILGYRESYVRGWWSVHSR